MELYVVTGGEANSVKRWQEDLSAQFYSSYDKDGKPKIVDGKRQYRRLLVAPIQLYKICFAKEEMPNVLAAVCPSAYIQERYKILRKSLNWIRRVLKLKEVPMPTAENPFLQPNQVDKAVFVLPIGIKDDMIDHNGEEMI